MIYLSNAFSLSMLNLASEDAFLYVGEITKEKAKEILSKNTFMSTIGHESTAYVMSQILGLEVKMNRATVQASEDDAIIVFQLLGARLPEGVILGEEEIARIPYKFFLIEQLPKYTLDALYSFQARGL